MPQTNGVAERTVQDVLDGARALMVHAGLPSCVWSYAAPYYSLLRSTRLISGYASVVHGDPADAPEDQGRSMYFGDGRFIALPGMRRLRVLHEEGV